MAFLLGEWMVVPLVVQLDLLKAFESVVLTVIMMAVLSVCETAVWMAAQLDLEKELRLAVW